MTKRTRPDDCDDYPQPTQSSILFNCPFDIVKRILSFVDMLGNYALVFVSKWMMKNFSQALPHANHPVRKWISTTLILEEAIRHQSIDLINWVFLYTSKSIEWIVSNNQVTTAAVKTGNINVLQCLIAKGLDLGKCRVGYPMLKRAVEMDDTRMILFLRDQGIRWCGEMYIWAIESKAFFLVKWLFDQKCTPVLERSFTYYGNSFKTIKYTVHPIMFVALETGDLGLVKTIYAEAARLKLEQLNGWGICIRVAELGYLDILQWGLSKLPSLFSSDVTRDISHAAARNGQPHILEWIYGETYTGIRIDPMDGTYSVMAAAIKSGDLETVKRAYIIDLKCGIFDMRLGDGNTWLAILYGHYHVFKWLIEMQFPTRTDDRFIESFGSKCQTMSRNDKKSKITALYRWRDEGIPL